MRDAKIIQHEFLPSTVERHENEDISVDGPFKIS